MDKFIVFDDVYNPSDDTFLLFDSIKHARGSLLDVGTGSGYIAINRRKICNDYVEGIDINPRAIENARINAHGLNNISFYVSDLFENVNKKFDIIVFNPPYLPNDIIVENKEQYNDDGVIERFIYEVSNYLKEKGSIYLLLSSVTPNLNNKLALIEELFYSTIIARKRLFFEEIFVLRMIPK